MLTMIAAVLLLLGPGWLAAWLGGASQRLRLAVAPALSVALWAIAAALLGVVGLGASLYATSALVVLEIAAIATAHRRRSGAWVRPSRIVLTPLHYAGVVGVVVAAELMDRVWSRAGATAESISGFGDVTWHSYLVRLLSSGTPANPFTFVPLDPAGGAGSQAYPWGMHIVAAMVRESTGASVAAALHTTEFAFLAVAYPIGLICLGTLATRAPRQRIVVAVLAPILAVGTFMFPWRIEHPLVFGAGVALLPGTAAVILQLIRVPGSTGLLLAALGIAGVTATHPSVMVALVLFVGACLLLGMERFGEFWPWWRPTLRFGAVALLAVPPAAFLVVRTFLEAGNVLSMRAQIHGSFPRWLLTVLTGNFGRPPQTLIFVLFLLAGACALLRRVLLGPMLFAAYFFALAAASRSTHIGFIHSMSGVWYDDVQRIAAFGAVIVPLLIATQLAWLGDRALGLAGSRLAGVPAARVATAAGLVALLVGVVVVRPQLGGNYRWVSRFYHPPAVTAGSLAAFEWLAGHAPGQRVMNPGVYGVSGWMYALDGVVPVVEQTTVAQALPARGYLLVCLNQIATVPLVRELLTSLNVHYVYTTAAITAADPTNPKDSIAASVPGLTGLDRLPDFRLAYSNGNSRVYEILPAPAGSSPPPPADCTIRAVPGWTNVVPEYAIKVAAAS